MCIWGDHNNNDDNDDEYLYSMCTNHHICEVLQFSVCDINGWSCSKFILKSKYTWTLAVYVKKNRSHGFDFLSSLQQE